MKDFFTSLEIARGISFDDFKATLFELRKKWSYRINSAPNAQKRSEAEIKVELINEAMVKIKDSASLDQYRFELNNPPMAVDSDTQSGSDDLEYEKDLKIANGFFADEDYQRAFEKANAILASGKKTADVYELVMLSLNNMGRHAESVSLGVEAIEKYGRTERKIFRALVFAYEKEGNHKKAHDLLMQLKRTSPDDVNSDFFIAQMLIEELGKKYVEEARGFVDNLLPNIDMIGNPEVARWDVQLVRDYGKSFPLLASKIATYSSGDYDKNSEFVKNTNNLFEGTLENYARDHYKEFEAYITSSDKDKKSDIDICCEKFEVCNITRTLATVKGTNQMRSTLDNILAKYRTQKISVACYSVIEYFSKLCVMELPTYGALVEYKAESLMVENDADYSSASNLLNPLSDVQKKTSGSGTRIWNLVEEVEQVHSCVKHRARRYIYDITSIPGVIAIYFSAVALISIISMLIYNASLNQGVAVDVYDLIQPVTKAAIRDFSNIVLVGYALVFAIIACAIFADINQRYKERNRVPSKIAKSFTVLFGWVIFFFVASLVMAIITAFADEVPGFVSSIPGVIAGFFSFLLPLHDAIREMFAINIWVAGGAWLVILIIAQAFSKKSKAVSTEIAALADCTALVSWLNTVDGDDSHKVDLTEEQVMRRASKMAKQMIRDLQYRIDKAERNLSNFDTLTWDLWTGQQESDNEFLSEVTKYWTDETDFPVQSLLCEKQMKLMSVNQEILNKFGKAAGYV